MTATKMGIPVVKRNAWSEGDESKVYVLFHIKSSEIKTRMLRGVLIQSNRAGCCRSV